MCLIVRLHFLPKILFPTGFFFFKYKCQNTRILITWTTLMSWNILRLARTTDRCSLKVLFCDHPSVLRQPNWSIVFISSQPTINELRRDVCVGACVLVISLRCDSQVRHFDCIQWHIMISHISVHEGSFTHTVIKICKTCIWLLLLLNSLFILTLDSFSLCLSGPEQTHGYTLWPFFLDSVPSIRSTLRPGSLWLVKRVQTCAFLYQCTLY